MPHLLIGGKIHESGLQMLREAPGVSFDYVEEVSEAAYLPLLEEADGLLIRTQPLSSATVEKAKRLKIVARHGVGYDAIDLEALNERGIILAIVGDVNSVSVAEQALMLILAAAKRAYRADRAVREGRWDWRSSMEAREVSGKNLLIIGYGRIGRLVARLAEPFGMNIRACDPFIQAADWPIGPATATGMTEGLKWADIISVSTPKTDRPLIGAAELALIKPGVVLVNTARGGIIEERAMVEALLSGRLAAAGLDVFEDEPPAPGSPLLELDQVIFSPHIAGLTEESADRTAVAAVKNLLDFFAGCIDPALVVNASLLRQ